MTGRDDVRLGPATGVEVPPLHRVHPGGQADVPSGQQPVVVGGVTPRA